MMDEKLLERLRCPISHRRLVIAEQPLLDQVNACIGNHQLQNRSGTTVNSTIEAATIDEARQHLFVVEKNVVNLIPDDAIDLDQLS